MSDKTVLQIDVTILNRDDMTSGAGPDSVGRWTYHHILPVKVYYLVASIMLRVAVNRDCWTRTRVLAIDALGKMCNSRANEAAIRLFVNDSIGRVRTDEQFRVYASRCTSPPFGGFGGPNPGQRSDDPGGNEELRRPHSMTAAWWGAVKRLSEVTYTALGLQAPPGYRQVVGAAHPIYEWCTLLEDLRTHIDFAHNAGTASFDETDWVFPFGEWVLLRGKQVFVRPIYRPRVRIRDAGQRRECIALETLGFDDATRNATIQRRNIRTMAANKDYIDSIE